MTEAERELLYRIGHATFWNMLDSQERLILDLSGDRRSRARLKLQLALRELRRERSARSEEKE